MYVRNEIKKSIHSGNVSSLILCAVSIISVLVSVMNDHFSMISFLFVIADILYAIEGEKFIHTGRISMFYRLYNYSYLFTSLLDIIRVLLSPAISHPYFSNKRYNDIIASIATFSNWYNPRIWRMIEICFGCCGFEDDPTLKTYKDDCSDVPNCSDIITSSFVFSFGLVCYKIYVFYSQITMIQMMNRFKVYKLK